MIMIARIFIRVFGLLVSSACWAMGMDASAFSMGSPGFLYNVGAQSFLAWENQADSKTLWIKGVSSGKLASRFKIHMGKYHSATYSLIMSADPSLLTKAKKKYTNKTSSLPFYGFPTMSRMGNASSEKHFGISAATTNPNSWFSFSPPITKMNFFKIYLNNQCLSVEREGYLKLEECVSLPMEKQMKQLFKWFPESEHIVVSTRYTQKISVQNESRAPRRKNQVQVRKQAPKKPTITTSVHIKTTIPAASGQGRPEINGKPRGYYDDPAVIVTNRVKTMVEGEDGDSDSYYQPNKAKFVMPPGFT
ncbi:uncharacterized protein NEMAJ01_1972 [Nematocida major]|uniref:uncharacterized protein n=1 Tax=Nematocida major TaxID=1912982 RepID=UPI002007C27A|nr:uncharacterized protein NEMAJ01_1972 [Nematocida major]KAH9387076.1 hypothetical protein NEMAJ01_1972 [Nematocida major]